ncbi:MAG: adenosylcobinamide amidohydrolase [Candidatus Bathyarchaeota archaeon]|nr:adenosylcobinamide amidohydrolase [Candidatus Bathyarchaeota archaeon]
MEQFDLANKKATLTINGNVLGVSSPQGLVTVSSAIFNGGFKRVQAVLNVSVPDDYSDVVLHDDPFKLIRDSAKRIGITQDYTAMVTAAKIENYAFRTKSSNGFSVYVAATAGCSHGESSGETIKIQEITGTINIIVLIDGKPSPSCMAAALITATEAKTASVRDLDIRSRYTGDAATGSITDSLIIASTDEGSEISYGGPASELGQLIGSCVRSAVNEAIIKQDGWDAKRSVLERLKERHLPVEKLVFELSKVEGLKVTVEGLKKVLGDNPVYASALMAAAKFDDDLQKGLVPREFGEVSVLAKKVASCVVAGGAMASDYEVVDLPPFLKQTLIAILKSIN